MLGGLPLPSPDGLCQVSAIKLGASGCALLFCFNIHKLLGQSFNYQTFNYFNLAFGRAGGPSRKTFEGKGEEYKRDWRRGAREGGAEAVTSAIRQQRGMARGTGCQAGAEDCRVGEEQRGKADRLQDL